MAKTIWAEGWEGVDGNTWNTYDANWAVTAPAGCDALISSTRLKYGSHSGRLYVPASATNTVSAIHSFSPGQYDGYFYVWLNMYRSKYPNCDTHIILYDQSGTLASAYIRLAGNSNGYLYFHGYQRGMGWYQWPDSLAVNNWYCLRINWSNATHKWTAAYSTNGSTFTTMFSGYWYYSAGWGAQLHGKVYLALSHYSTIAFDNAVWCDGLSFTGRLANINDVTNPSYVNDVAIQNIAAINEVVIV
jgi:hypothetical protein